MSFGTGPNYLEFKCASAIDSFVFCSDLKL
jgi:hypothetical protein